MVYGDHGYGGIPARRGREVAGIILSMWFVAWMGVFFTSVARSQISITLDHTHHALSPTLFRLLAGFWRVTRDKREGSKYVDK